MARFPRIQSPCPYKGEISAYMDGETCRMCHRQVHDLNTMDDSQRQVFLQSCSGEVCVSYSLPLRPAMAAAAAALAMAAAPMAAAAQEVTPEPEMDVMEIFIGGIKDPSNVEYIEDASDQTLADLPVIYEDDDSGQSATDQAAADPAGSGA